MPMNADGKLKRGHVRLCAFGSASVQGSDLQPLELATPKDQASLDGVNLNKAY